MMATAPFAQTPRMTVTTELKSANFNVTELEPGKIGIVTKGHGHGFGLSQYTAQKMAEKGEDYRKILQYFFPGTELENVE